jgi:hypothetical protein
MNSIRRARRDNLEAIRPIFKAKSSLNATPAPARPAPASADDAVQRLLR